MDVRNLLARRYSVSEKKIDAFTTDPAATNCVGQTVADAKHVGAYVCVEVGQVWRMSNWHNQEMPGIHGLNIHERAHETVPKYKVRLLAPGHDVAKHTGGRRVGHAV